MLGVLKKVSGEYGNRCRRRVGSLDRRAWARTKVRVIFAFRDSQATQQFYKEDFGFLIELYHGRCAPFLLLFFGNFGAHAAGGAASEGLCDSLGNWCIPGVIQSGISVRALRWQNSLFSSANPLLIAGLLYLGSGICLVIVRRIQFGHRNPAFAGRSSLARRGHPRRGCGRACTITAEAQRLG
jgi:hypothetical protein